MTPIIELQADIEKGLSDLAGDRVKDFDRARIIERGRKLLKEAFPAEAFTETTATNSNDLRLRTSLDGRPER
jgi:hypothetical protein